jgi:hypothetical protein
MFCRHGSIYFIKFFYRRSEDLKAGYFMFPLIYQQFRTKYLYLFSIVSSFLTYFLVYLLDFYLLIYSKILSSSLFQILLCDSHYCFLAYSLVSLWTKMNSSIISGVLLAGSFSHYTQAMDWVWFWYAFDILYILSLKTSTWSDFCTDRYSSCLGFFYLVCVLATVFNLLPQGSASSSSLFVS